MRTSNPALNEDAFRLDSFEMAPTMTVEGTAIKTCGLLALVISAAGYTWFQAVGGHPIQGLTYGGLIVGLVFALATIFKPAWAPVTAPLYAIAEGLFLGGISVVVQAMYPEVPIVTQAVALTFGTMFAMLFAYQSGLIKPTEQFKAGIIAATGGICLVYLVTIVLSFFGVSIPYIHGSGIIGIGFSLFVVVIAALNLVLDFDFIAEASSRGAPKSMEWYGAFALLVTLVWLYLEILRLLSKLNSRD